MAIITRRIPHLPCPLIFSMLKGLAMIADQLHRDSRSAGITSNNFRARGRSFRLSGQGS
jgi:hypothetical protein